MDPSDLAISPHRVIARGAAAIGLLGIALIHLLDLQSKLEETPYLAVAYLGLIAVAVTGAALLVHGDDRRTWIACTGIALATFAAYAVNRTIGMPSATGDIGNWLEPIGLASLFVEATTVAVGIYALTDRRAAAAPVHAQVR